MALGNSKLGKVFTTGWIAFGWKPLFLKAVHQTSLYMQHKICYVDSKPLYTLKDFTSSSESPSHLVVLVHGLHGSSRDFLFVEKSLLQLDETRNLIVFRPSVNEGRTTDGIVKGGSRLAEAVKAFCSKYPSLRSISFVGFSLGELFHSFSETF